MIFYLDVAFCWHSSYLVWWQNWDFLVYPVLRHIQCFIAFSGRTDPTECKSAACKVGTLEEILLLTKFKMAPVETSFPITQPIHDLES